MTVSRPRVTIYTDGGASPNPGPGGWGAILIHESSGATRELSGNAPETTNNRMELTAAIEALAALKGPCEVALYTDSEYLQRGISEWLPRWIRQAWQLKDGQPVANEDLWRRLADLTGQHQIEWHWLRGHAGTPLNERAHRLAGEAMRQASHSAGTADEPTDAAIYLGVSARDGSGVWAALIRLADDEEILVGREDGVSSSALELMAAIEALTLLPEQIHVSLYTYSDYLRQGAAKWLPAWQRRGWKTRDGSPVKNRELWEQLDEEIRIRRITWPDLPADDPPPEFEQLTEAIREAMQGPQGDFRWD